MRNEPVSLGSQITVPTVPERLGAFMRDNAELIIADSATGAVVCAMLYIAFRAVTLLA
jgi:hypothetical protein